ncbi:MAG: chromosomal replication initiator protein DnaA [Candidatus Marinimicrobia bacterium]|nr:chromosomal replication initiator protein DnaA [Candidatus Neomarinimicrobiota bacterium]
MKESVSKIWDLSLKDIRENIPEHTFQAWFKTIEPVSFDGGIFKINVPNMFHFEWLETNYKEMITQTLSKFLEEDFQLQFLINKIPDDSFDEQDKVPSSQQYSSTQTAPPLLPQREKYINTQINTILNKQYTFDSFIEGPNSQFAKVASRAVAEAPGNTAFNPLMIYGGTGLGKTHLLHAIGNMAIDNNPNKQVIYVSTERFVKDFLNAIQKNKMSAFGNIYRKADILLIDDIQSLEGKTATQEQFFNTFNELYQHGKQIVITADRTPKDLTGLTDRLISRFLQGLIVDIQPPDYESRIAILQYKADTENLIIPDEVLEFIAKNIESNVRELEGAVTKMFVHSSLMHTDITLALAKKIVGEILGLKKNHIISFNAILKSVAEYYNLSENEIVGKSRVKEIAFARQIVMYLNRKLSGDSLKTIGIKLGGRDHTTVIHGHKLIEEKLKKEKKFKKDIDAIKMQIDFASQI